MEINVCDNVYNCDQNCVIKYLDAIRNHYCALRNKFIVAENELNLMKIENINLKDTIKGYESKDCVPKSKSPSETSSVSPVLTLIKNKCKENDLLKTPTRIKKSNTCRTPLTPKNKIDNTVDKKYNKVHIIKLFHDDANNIDLTNNKGDNFKSPANKKKLKQSKIDDKYLIKSNNNNNIIDTDETFCDELIIASPTSLAKKTQQKSCLRLRPKKLKTTFDADKNERHSINIKEEPILNINDTNISNKSCDDIEMKTLEPHVILIDDTENFNTDLNTNDFFKNSENNTNLLNLLEANCLKNLEPDDSNELSLDGTPKSSDRVFILCKDCEQKKNYYKYIDELTDNKIKQLENECFKHRPKHYTPENFWQPFFTPTQD